MAEENNSVKKKSPKFSASEIVILLIGLLTLLASIGILAVIQLKGGKGNQPEEASMYNLKELHVFPPIDFVDSLYYRKVLVSYNDDEESPRDVYYYEKDSVGMPTTVKVHESHYYPGNKKYIDGNVSKNQRDGLWYAYHKNGNVQTMAHYRNGKEDGQYVVYYENGSVRYTGMYKDGKRVGTWCFYDENENFEKSQNFDQK